MRKLLVVSAALLLAVSQQAAAVIVTQWNFNSVPPDASTSTGSSVPSIGAGAATAVGGTVASFASGASNGGSSDPVVTDDTGWGLTTFPAASAANLTAGAEFAVSTIGFENVTVSYDLRHSNTASRYEQAQYSIDGTNFISFGPLFDGNAGDTWFNGRSVDLSSISGVNNNANFKFRVVSAFAPSTSSYAPSTSTSAYATTGTWRFDMVTVNGDVLAAIPEPGAYLFGAVATLMAGAGVYRRRFLA